MEPGDLQIFAGKCSLHRVSAVKGKKARYSLTLGYVVQPDLITAKATILNSYGRSHPRHDFEAGRLID